MARVPDGWNAVLSMAREGQNQDVLDAIEVFAGVGNVTDACLERGLHCWKYEIQDSAAEDVLTNEASGIRNENREYFYIIVCLISVTCMYGRNPEANPTWITLTTAVVVRQGAIGVQLLLEKLAWVRKRGMLFMSPPCSSWVWMSRSKSRRTKSTPCGSEDSSFVVQGNQVAEVVSSLMLLASEQGIDFVIEQPLSSLFFSHPSVESAIRQIPGVTRVSFRMSAFGSKSQKPSLLVGTAPWLSKVKDAGTQRPPKALVQLAERTDDGQVNGKRKLLQESSAYPIQFCRVLADFLAEHLHESYVLLRLGVGPMCAQLASPSKLASTIMAFLAEVFVGYVVATVCMCVETEETIQNATQWENMLEKTWVRICLPLCFRWCPELCDAVVQTLLHGDVT
eukprot:6455945-Amphidinium_carterae.4